MDFATHNNEGPDEVLNVNLAAGNTLTSHEAAPIGDLTPFIDEFESVFGKRQQLYKF